MPRLKLNTLERKMQEKHYTFESLPEKVNCPGCKGTAEKIFKTNRYVSGTGILYHCKSCDLEREYII
ncbi:hypothetical protein J4226_05000 [Candidatus Pacearchaeota archaeon]|nr:hypothetical protein [Candidatus Pacearchaeota archaeon]